MALTLTDGVLGSVLLLSMLVGLWRGLVREWMSLAGWVGAFVAAQWLADDVAQALPLWREAAAQVRYALAFVLVFVACMFAVALLSWLLGKVVAGAGLAPVDRSMGAVFGLLRGVVMLLVLAVLVHLLGMRSQAWWQQSQLTAVVELLLAGLKPALPASLQGFLP